MADQEALAAEQTLQPRTTGSAEKESVLAQFLPLSIKGVSMNDGSISFGPNDLKIVLGYVTNACSFGDFVNASMKGRRDFGAPDTAVTQLAVAQELVRAANAYDDMLAALKQAGAHINIERGWKADDPFVDFIANAIAKATGATP